MNVVGLLNLVLSGALIVLGILAIVGQAFAGNLVVAAGVLLIIVGILMIVGRLEGGLIFGIVGIVAGALILAGNFPFMEEIAPFLNYIVGGALIVIGVMRLARR